MVLFVPRPWYRCYCRHSWQTTLWHALLTWTYKMSPSFLLLNRHSPQFHRIKTWLSYTSLLPKLFLVLGFACISRAIFSNMSYPVSDAITNLVALDPFYFWLGIERLPTHLKLFYLPILLSMNSLSSETREISMCFIHGITPVDFPLWNPIDAKLPLILFVSTMKIQKEERQPYHEAMVQRSGDFKYDGSNSLRSATKIEKTR